MGFVGYMPFLVARHTLMRLLTRDGFNTQKPGVTIPMVTP